jgi:hypothetical protein
LSHLPYEERLKMLKMPQLEEIFDRAALIPMFLLTHNLFPEEMENFYLLREHFLTNGALKVGTHFQV